MGETILGGFLTVFGAVGVLESLVDLIRARRSHEWHMMPAEIVESRVERRRGGHGSGTRFVPVIRYRYAVNGTTYAGQRVQFARLETPSREDADRVVGDSPVGATVVVRVSPSNARLSVIQAGQDGRSWYYILAFGSFGAFGVLLLTGLLK